MVARRDASQISTVIPSTPDSTQKSSILRSAFSPTSFQLSLFASVIQGFNSQRLRIHNTVSGRLRCEHAAEAGTKITSLDWGYYGTAYRDSTQPSKKKRKRRAGHEVIGHNAGSVVVAFGTSDSHVCLYSPAEAKIVGRLSGGHDKGVKDFRFSGGDFLKGWSIGGDGKLVQWDMKTGQPIRYISGVPDGCQATNSNRYISLQDPSICTLAPIFQTIANPKPDSPDCSYPEVICASSTPYAVFVTSGTEHRIDTFDSFKNPVHSVIRSNAKSTCPNELFLAADNGRYLNIYDIAKKRLLRSLVAGSGVNSLSLSRPEHNQQNNSPEVLVVVTQNGLAEIFSDPFVQPTEHSEVDSSIKSNRKGMTRKANVSIKVIQPDTKGSISPIFQASVRGADVVVAMPESGVGVTFQRVRWRDEETGEFLARGVLEVVKANKVSTLNSAMMNGVKDVGRVDVDESKTVVVDRAANGALKADTVEISSDEEGGGPEEDPEENDDQSMQSADHTGDFEGDMAVEGTAEKPLHPRNDRRAVDEEREEYNNDDDGTEDGTGEPTFGELLASKHSGTISVVDSLVPADCSTLVQTGREKILSHPSGMSLSTVLAQSLRTNDQNLLESCLHATDVNTIRLTVQRLDPSLAGILLQRLAERLSSRPGRYGHLLVWVQWTCVAHGGALAGRAEITSKIKTLYQVLTQRSRTLDNLLLLKGKLDMLEAQLSLRHQLRAERGQTRDTLDENDVIYIEGEDGDSSSDVDKAVGGKASAIKPGVGKKSLPEIADQDADSKESEDLPMANGIIHSDEDSDEEDDETGDSIDEGDLVDVEAEESSNDGHPSDRRESYNDEEEDSDEEDSEMDDFIDDGSLSEDAVESDLSADDTPQKPPSKKTKRL